MWRYTYTTCLWSLILVTCFLLALRWIYPSHQPASTIDGNSQSTGFLAPYDTAPSNPALVRKTDTGSIGSICNNKGLSQNGKEWKKLTNILEGYKYFHSDHVSRNTSRVLIWSCYHRCTGIGDQLQEIAVTLLLSIVSQRVLLLHWEDSYSMMKFLRPGQINWSVSALPPRDAPQTLLTGNNLVEAILSPTEHVVISKKITVPFWQGYVQLKAVDGMKKLFEEIGLSDILPTRDDRNKVPFVLGLFFRVLFNFSRDLILQLEQTQADLSLKNEQYVAVHLRTGFLGSSEEEVKITRTKASRSAQTWERAINCSLQLADTKYGVNSPVLLATDSVVVRTWAAQMYGDRIRTTSYKLTHSANSQPREEVGGWMDFLLLARAGHLVRGSSGFSLSAGALCYTPEIRQCSLNCWCRETYHF